MIVKFRLKLKCTKKLEPKLKTIPKLKLRKASPETEVKTEGTTLVSVTGKTEAIFEA